MSRPKRESPSLPRPYAQLLADSEARRRAAVGDEGIRLDPDVQLEPTASATAKP